MCWSRPDCEIKLKRIARVFGPCAIGIVVVVGCIYLCFRGDGNPEFATEGMGEAVGGDVLSGGWQGKSLEVIPSVGAHIGELIHYSLVLNLVSETDRLSWVLGRDESGRVTRFSVVGLEGSRVELECHVSDPLVHAEARSFDGYGESEFVGGTSAEIFLENRAEPLWGRLDLALLVDAQPIGHAGI